VFSCATRKTSVTARLSRSCWPFVCQGNAILIPFGENTRYDLVVDYGSKLSRVQCKTGRLRNGVVRFATCSSYAHHPNSKVMQRDYEGQIDEFAVFCPDLGTVYLVPIEDVATKREGCLRVTPALNAQRKRIRLATAYEIARIEID
jgi:PD-(D/E)XK endonuclease